MRKGHICLRSGKLLKLAKEFGRSLSENIYDPIFQYRLIEKAKIWFDIDIYFIIQYQHYNWHMLKLLVLNQCTPESKIINLGLIIIAYSMSHTAKFCRNILNRDLKGLVNIEM